MLWSIQPQNSCFVLTWLFSSRRSSVLVWRDWEPSGSRWSWHACANECMPDKDHKLLAHATDACSTVLFNEYNEITLGLSLLNTMSQSHALMRKTVLFLPPSFHQTLIYTSFCPSAILLIICYFETLSYQIFNLNNNRLKPSLAKWTMPGCWRYSFHDESSVPQHSVI